MSIELEERLRRAYAQVPTDPTARAEVLARSRRAAIRTRRRRTGGIGAGAAAAALVIGAAATLGPGLAGSGDDTGHLTAAGLSSTAIRSPKATVAVPTVPAHVAPPSTSTKPPLPKEDTDKPLAGLSGRLLPHGSQLPAKTLYRGINSEDYQKTWRTSLADGYAYGMPLQFLIGSDQELNAPSPAKTRDAYGILSTVLDVATSPDNGTDPVHMLGSSIARFRTPSHARSALAKAQRREGGLYWTKPQLTTPNVPWSGVPGVTGDHGVYDFPTDAPQKVFVAYQVVGAYIVSADSESASTAEQAVTDMVGNLKTTGLLG